MDHDLENLDRDGLIAEVKRLRNAIRTHRESTGHGLCWYQPEMWALLPERADIQIEVPPWDKFMRGCIRYRRSLDAQAKGATVHDQEFEE